MRARCDVMADRSDREQGQPNRCPRRHSLMNRMGPCSRTPSGPAVSNRLHQQAGQKTAPDQCHCVNLSLATREPSTEDIVRPGRLARFVHDSVAKVVLPKVSQILRAAGAIFVQRSEGPHRLRLNSQATSVTRPRLSESSIASRFKISPKIRTDATFDCCNSSLPIPDMRSRRAPASRPADGYFLNVRRRARDRREDVPKLRGLRTCV